MAMQGIIDGGRYKVIEVLKSGAGYKACLCNDVTRNDDYAPLLFNIYSGKDEIRLFLPLYYAMKDSGYHDFMRLVTSDGCVCAVFNYHGGERFGTFFARHPAERFEEKLTYADRLLAAALETDMLDEVLVNGALREENAVVDEKNLSVHFNVFAPPCALAKKGFRAQRLGEMLGMIFRPDRYLPAEITDFIESLESSDAGCVEIYSMWRRVREQALETRRSYEKESYTQYLARKARDRKRRLLKKKNEQ